ncbi:uncharacterized protein LOC129230250 [Uloborus diversus]|uniref:uncharacterized protein LOC129230250 n=1 Tax=Uloborus diversus TaxID=327109 RepID=UPI002409C8BC|nr:uncharacterized protein LOC129230250 [Uloborus diversus]
MNSTNTTNKQKKKSVKSSITKLQKKTEEEIENLNKFGLLARKERFIEFKTEVKGILDPIISICEEKDEETYCTEKDHLLDTLEAVLVTIDTRLVPSVVNSEFQVKTQDSSQTSVPAQSAEVELPTLSLPVFSGATEEWLTFSDLFEAAVSNNQNLTGAQKLQYLKGSLRSDALKIVNSLSITNDNFEIAWRLLRDRYFNKREIVSSLMKRFINITPLSGESSTQILNLIDSTKEFVRMLESLEYEIDPTADTLLMHMILFKLDTNSRTWFERTFSTDVIPKLDELLQFLATQARSIPSLTTKRNVQRKVTLVAFSAQSQCPLCTNELRENSGVVDVTSCLSDVGPDVQILLCTVLIQVRDIWGNYQTCRCLLDSGSQASLITNECIEKLGLHRKKANVRISCLGASDTRTNGIAEIQFTSHFPSQKSFEAPVYVVNKIVGMLPHHNLDSSMCELFGDISLADPTFYKSGPIDVLLGIDLTLPLLKGQTLSLGKDKPFAIRSELGWIIGGKANFGDQNSLHVNNIQLVLDHLINKFWELDSVPCAKQLTSLEKSCEDHFAKTHSRDENGRYTVRLPFHTPPTRLGDSKQNAIRRLISVERHLISNLEKYELYRKFMKEYLDLKHKELVPDSEINNINSLYLPHHGVNRNTSSTTKLRVVFDASSKTSSGLSLNDLLMVGPRVQPELFPILIQFRLFNVAICADVEKMFRQIKVHEEDVDWQRILGGSLQTNQ